MIGEVRAFLPGRVVRLHPATRRATVSLRSVGRGRSYAGAYVAPTSELAPVTAGGLRPGRRLGKVVAVDPTEAGAELSLIVGDADTWQALAAGDAKISALVAFTGSSGGDPVDGRPLRIEIG